MLLDLFNNVPPTPEQIRFTAIAANAAGDVADAYYYMAEYHLMSGDLMLAINQLELALAVPDLTEVQRERFEARLERAARSTLPKERSRARRRRETPAGRGARNAGGASVESRVAPARRQGRRCQDALPGAAARAASARVLPARRLRHARNTAHAAATRWSA